MSDPVGRPALHVVGEPFSDYVERSSVRLQRFAYLLCHNHEDARDLVQDALIGAYQHRQRLTDDGALDAYVKRSIVNGNISRWRKHSRVVVTDPLTMHATAPDAAERIADADVAWRLCQELPPNQRAAVVLRYYDDLDYAAIARILDCPETTARTHVHRALATLRGRLDEGALR